MRKNIWKISYKMTDEYLNQAIALDNSVYQSVDVGDFKKCKEWLSVNDEIYTILTYNDIVVGYINFMPITDICYTKILSGCFKDCNITRHDILPFSNEYENNCLMTSIVVHKDFRNSLAGKRLWDGFINKIIKLKNKNINIANVVMDCVTDIGEKCAINYLNAKFVYNSSTGKIYKGKLVV